ncbi:hypothetical protein RM445_32055, partial [Pseudonocardia sp. DSM 45834]|nr:hypothetical protein [Pseudonocardia sp. DSM 45834]
LDVVRQATEIGATERTLPREWKDWFTRVAMPPMRVPELNMSSEVDHLAVEVFEPGLAQLLMRIDEAGLTNLRSAASHPPRSAECAARRAGIGNAATRGRQRLGDTDDITALATNRTGGAPSAAGSRTAAVANARIAANPPVARGRCPPRYRPRRTL